MIFLLTFFVTSIHTFNYNPGTWIGLLGWQYHPPWTDNQKKLSFWNAKTGDVYLFKDLLKVPFNTTVESMSISIDTMKIGLIHSKIDLKRSGGNVNKDGTQDYWLSIYDYSNLKTKQAPMSLGYCTTAFEHGEYTVCSQYVYGLFYIITTTGNVYSTTSVQGATGGDCGLKLIGTIDSSSVPSVSFPCDFFVKGSSFHYLSNDLKNYVSLVMKDNKLYAKSFQRIDETLTFLAASVIDQESGNFFYRNFMSQDAYELIPNIYQYWEVKKLETLSEKPISILGSDGRYFKEFQDTLLVNFFLDNATTSVMTANTCEEVWKGPTIKIPPDFNTVDIEFRYDPYHSISN